MADVNFSSQWSTAIIQISSIADDIQQQASEELFELIKENSPIGDPSTWKWPAHKDYIPGAFKAAWQISYNGESIEIFNDLPYAARLEKGWSQQAPLGVMRVSVQEFPAIIAAVAARHK